MGYLKNHLSSKNTPEAKRSKQELMGLIGDYRQGLLQLIVPLTLLKHRVCHRVTRYSAPDWVHQQVWLHPYPKELMLRNHE